MKVHEIKILPKYFQDVLSNKKRFEVRKNDRDYHVGDTVALREWDGEKYTGSSLCVKITYMLTDNVPGIEKGYCVFGIRRINNTTYLVHPADVSLIKEI